MKFDIEMRPIDAGARFFKYKAKILFQPHVRESGIVAKCGLHGLRMYKNPNDQWECSKCHFH